MENATAKDSYEEISEHKTCIVQSVAIAVPIAKFLLNQTVISRFIVGIVLITKKTPPPENLEMEILANKVSKAEIPELQCIKQYVTIAAMNVKFLFGLQVKNQSTVINVLAKVPANIMPAITTTI